VRAYYDFDEQLRKGEEGERALRDYFAEVGATTRPATRAEQRAGIDFLLLTPTGRESVEVKTDETAGHTHNAFIETISVDATARSGWAYTCTADWLAYYVPTDGVAYLIKPARLRTRLPRWLRTYPTRTALNAGYCTHGVVVPLVELERVAECAICP
jgi:hypothetical protein